MKLLNKKTGKFGYMLTSKDIDEYMIIDDDYFKIISYDSLAKVNEEWEDYKPQEPLIKDEKIRKAVRAWAEALKVDVIRFERFSQGFSFGDGNVYSSINFDGCVFKLEDGKEYTITELCGVEEECE